MKKYKFEWKNVNINKLIEIKFEWKNINLNEKCKFEWNLNEKYKY
jgi:hypothetical protein